VPDFLLRPTLRRLFKAGVVSFPPEELDHLQYLCVVDGARAARELGWAPRHSLRETIRSVLP
jgi:UDP-glucose 4-epimerase